MASLPAAPKVSEHCCGSEDQVAAPLPPATSRAVALACGPGDLLPIEALNSVNHVGQLVLNREVTGI
jgi:hypothetical protein